MKEVQSQILFRVTESFVTRKLTYQVILERDRDSKKTDRQRHRERDREFRYFYEAMCYVARAKGIEPCQLQAGSVHRKGRQTTCSAPDLRRQSRWIWVWKED